MISKLNSGVPLQMWVAEHGCWTFPVSGLVEVGGQGFISIAHLDKY